MSADDHLSPQQFYHGSPWKIDGQVEPEGDEHAFFTTDHSVARAYARGPARHGYVYTVRPTGEYDADPDEGNAYRSRHPLKITGVQLVKFGVRA